MCKFPETHGFNLPLNFICKSREKYLGGKVAHLRPREELPDEPLKDQNLSFPPDQGTPSICQTHITQWTIF